MKRFALAILVVASVAGLAFAVLHRPAAEGSLYPTITVNSTDDTDARNNKLTLREAMMLATGYLTLGDLTQGECDQVSGTQWWGWPVYECLVQIGSVAPGAKSADTIVFNTGVFPPGSPATIMAYFLPYLETDNDTVDGSGAGVIVEGNGVFVCFEIISNNNTIKGLEIRNCGVAVYLEHAQSNTIGGDTPSERNVISGCDVGIKITGESEGNVVRGNYIGTNAAGDAAVPNARTGVRLTGSYTTNNTIGGSGPGEGNLISGNSLDGIYILWSENNLVLGNLIGADASGTVAVPNGDGIDLRSDNNVVGGTGAGEPNIIAFNDEDGVHVVTMNGNAIRGNSIHSNGGKGIELEWDFGPEPPIVETAGSVSGTACPNCIVDIYSDEEDEGKVYEGSTTADGDGNWSFSGTPEGPNITATATDSDGNTSEFSQPLEPPWPTPTAESSPTPTPTPTPTLTPGPTVTPTPPTGPTRTVVWTPGWHNETWSGASTPEEAFSCAAGNYAAAYRLVSGGWERYFPDRPEISNMGPLNAYDAFLILVTGDVTCEMAVADPAATERTLDWGVGWQNEGWTDPDGTPPQNAFACAAGNYAAAYRLVGGGWERHFPDRPDISNMGPLNKYDAFLILATASVSCTMPIAPGGDAARSPFIGAWESTDVDGSHQTLTVGGGGGGVYHVTVFDDKATTGCPVTGGSVAGTGSGSVEGDTLHVEGSVLCPSEGLTYPWDVDFTHDPSDDTLDGPSGGDSVQWNRIGQ